MLRLKEGDAVQVVDRAATAADVRSGLFYNYYRNLSGTVFKLYGSGETQQAAVEVDQNTLPVEVVERHQATRNQMCGTGPGETKRQRAQTGDQEFHLRYVILIASADLARPKRR